MELYLLKSAVILTILYGFYKLVLENENMHVFKRFYLLGSLPVAFLIPLVTFTSYVEVPVSSTPVFVTNTLPMATPEVSINPWPYILWGLYALGMVFFSIKFGKNLNQLISKIKNNPKFTRDSIHHVLLKMPVIPHTFLNYVFLNKQKFEAREIPDEVIAHEHVHARQKHSIDILVVELLQIVFWFNPLLYFIKRSIKLNHEFLADRAVLNRGTDTATYQNILLAISSPATTPALANSINYSFIKKRITVMKKQTSTQAIWLRSLLLLPLLALILYGFSTKEVIQKQTLLEENGKEVIQENFKNTISENNNSSTIEISDSDLVEHIQIHVNSKEEFTLNGHKTTINSIEEKLKNINPNLSQEDRKKLVNVYIYSDGKTKMGFISDIKNELIKYGIRQFISQPLDDIPQEKATKAEIEEYNTLAKKYNNMSQDNMRIIRAEVDRMTVIYNKMTPQQKENGEPFPNFPPPPPAPDAPDAPKVGKNPPLPPLPAAPPPAPLSDPIEYIKALHKSGAVFFIGPHQYYYEEVLEMAKKTNDLNIDISQYPKVNLLGC